MEVSIIFDAAVDCFVSNLPAFVHIERASSKPMKQHIERVADLGVVGGEIGDRGGE